MTILELKNIIKDLPDDMPVGLLDETTDGFFDRNYALTDENFQIDECVAEEDGEVVGKMLFICFENKLNENPI